MEVHNAESCTRARMAIRDTLDVVGGKWKLVLISVLRNGNRRFNELARDAGISPRILSKELHELEMNGLITRQVLNTRPVTVEYGITEYADTLNEVLNTMIEWGVMHRAKIMSGQAPPIKREELTEV